MDQQTAEAVRTIARDEATTAVNKINVPSLGQAADDVTKSLMRNRAFLYGAGIATGVIVTVASRFVYNKLTASE